MSASQEKRAVRSYIRDCKLHTCVANLACREEIDVSARSAVRTLQLYTVRCVYMYYLYLNQKKTHLP